MLLDLVSYVIPGGRALKLIKNGVNITNSTSPLHVIKNITLTVVDCCAPPPVKLVAHCIAASALIAISVTNRCPNYRWDSGSFNY
jgi:hypothetical protein